MCHTAAFMMRFLIVSFIFFLNFVWGCCNGRGQIWDNREMNGVTMHDGKITQNTLKERKLSKKVKNE